MINEQHRWLEVTGDCTVHERYQGLHNSLKVLVVAVLNKGYKLNMAGGGYLESRLYPCFSYNVYNKISAILYLVP